jgi:hypothetical protein
VGLAYYGNWRSQILTIVKNSACGSPDATVSQGHKALILAENVIYTLHIMKNTPETLLPAGSIFFRRVPEEPSIEA